MHVAYSVQYAYTLLVCICSASKLKKVTGMTDLFLYPCVRILSVFCLLCSVVGLPAWSCGPRRRLATGGVTWRGSSATWKHVTPKRAGARQRCRHSLDFNGGLIQQSDNPNNSRQQLYHPSPVQRPKFYARFTLETVIQPARKDKLIHFLA